MMRRAPQTHGFTLLEMLVVLVLIAITAGMVQWSIGSHRALDALRQDAGNAAALLAIASNYSLEHQQALGLMAGDAGYELMAYDAQEQRWRPLGDDAAYKQSLPGDVRLAVAEEPGMPDIPADNADGPPAAIIDTDGTISPCRIVFRWKSNPTLAVTLTVGNDGVISIASGGGSDGGS